MRQATIYTLVDPRDGLPRYVGRTLMPLVLRLRNHLRDRRKSHPRALWLKELWDLGLRPIIVAMETVPFDDMIAAERRWAAKLTAEGHILLNDRKVGGGSCRSYVIQLTPEIEGRLGHVADAVLAAELGVSRKAITYYRQLKDIPAAYDRTRNTPPPPRAGWNRLDLPADIVAALGTMPDYRLAEQAQVSKKAINRARRALGIPSYAEQTGASGKFAAGAPHPRWSRPKGGDLPSRE